ncbi:hypothetical protein BDV29DRAFT_190161 [Aspergillus leporis]|uniref:P-loop containing nucleoside triphosphate hydrolase protein n=1 Tax=Aspergillus leporis TaxID=41062 RepID=A0A5N5X636_9EURO|nr:hypothetical protein BDV29DRAFT_190161 [Aspergillus leporis]
MEAIKKYIYSYPKPPPRVRNKPLHLICVGLSRSGTESLRVALQKLGYDTYHGWDSIMETMQHISKNGAYPDAKVILNRRRGLDAWHRSIMKTVIRGFVDQSFFWAWEVYYTNRYPGLFRGPCGGNVRAAIERNGKWLYREHSNMIHGLVPKERLLEWGVEDGWGPLCKGGVDKKVNPQTLAAIRKFLNTMTSVGVVATSIMLGVKEEGIPWESIGGVSRHSYLLNELSRLEEV